MATQTPNKPPAGGAGKKAGNILTRKLGPAPVWVWGAVVIGLYLAYRYYENNKASSTAAAAGDTGTTDSTDTTPADSTSSGGASSTPADNSSGSTPDATDPYAAVDSLLTALLSGGAGAGASGGGGTGGGGSNPGIDIPPAVPFPGTPIAPGSVGETLPAAPTATGVTSANPPHVGTVAATPAAPEAVTGKQITGAAYGGIVSTKKLASGATLTTFATGRQVEQAPGKAPYVVKK